MADRVMRLTHVGNVDHTTQADRVVITVNGTSGGKSARVELHLDYIDLANVIREMRQGADTQLKRWKDAREALGND